ncbi:MAG TPA: serine hydrolase domain-containing protein [Mycobacteriales bacterium]|nr:serine hydrolase domain-containing protein [Mycobacteriales bacterium]
MVDTSGSTDWLVAPGYEAVADAFTAGAGTLGYGGGAYCAYVGGKPVIDVWAGMARPDVPWQSDTRSVLMSSTKGYAVMCMQILVDRGRIDVEAPVADYWPEFAANGKAVTTVRHLLMHTAGVIGFDGMNQIARLDASGWDDYDALATGLAAAAPAYPPGTKHCYHALTIGWLLAELVRRVDGRTIGRFFADELAGPLGLDVSIGTSAADLERVAQVRTMRFDHMPRPMRRAQDAYLAAARNPATLLGRAFLGDGTRSGIDELELLFNSGSVLGAEFPAGGGTATARAMARAWAAMAQGGELDGARVLSEGIVDAWSHVVSREPDILMNGVLNGPLAKLAVEPAPRTLGYIGNIRRAGAGWRFGPSPDAYGSEGLGGQYGYCDPLSDIAVGFIRSEMAVIEVLQPQVTTALYECAARLGHRVAPIPRQSVVRRAVDRVMRRAVAVPAPAGAGTDRA